jgi:prepilin-type N-terminal cleavage/methylation domain-containing protein
MAAALHARRFPMAAPTTPHRRAAFTLIELLAAMSVIAILSGLVISGIRGSEQRALIARARTELSALAGALESYRQYYGDYPQLGEFAHADLIAAVDAGPGTQTAEAKLLNCLSGRFAPGDFDASDLHGPDFLRPLATRVTFRPATDGPILGEQNSAFVDPFGNWYRYYYKSRATAGVWGEAAYVLVSAGPNHAHLPPDLTTGIYPAAALAASANADDVRANR